MTCCQKPAIVAVLLWITWTACPNFALSFCLARREQGTLFIQSFHAILRCFIDYRFVWNTKKTCMRLNSDVRTIVLVLRTCQKAACSMPRFLPLLGQISHLTPDCQVEKLKNGSRAIGVNTAPSNPGAPRGALKLKDLKPQNSLHEAAGSLRRRAPSGSWGKSRLAGARRLANGTSGCRMFFCCIPWATMEKE